ncbi:MAG: autotransporter outer membrane beta-barrel domain-containing protein [Caulobacter sp.]|nr:autotransporter outer membrane beta-barrel domain-containing protein [Caulobacter sp.]
MSSAPRAKTGARTRALLLSTASTAIGGFLALAAIGAPGVALAQDECGVAAPGGDTVTCTAAGNPYPNGITYFPPGGDLTINLEGDVVIDTSGGLNPGILALNVGADALTIDGLTGASITTDADGGFGILGFTDDGDLTINISTIDTSGANAFGIVGGSATGDVSVTAGTISTTGLGANAIDILTNSGNIDISGFTITTDGDNAFAVNASSDAGGDVNVTGSTFITTGAGSTGIRANADFGDVSVTPSAVITEGDNAVAILATSVTGDVTVDVFQAQTLGANSDSIVATSLNGAVTVNATAVTADGVGARGIVATGGTSVTVTSTGFFAGTGGDGGTAILVRSGSGPATVTGGNVFTSGANAAAFDVASVSGDIDINAGGTTTSGAGSTGILARGAGLVDVSSSSLQTSGDNAIGIDAASTAGTVVISGGQISTTGAGSTGLLVNSQGLATIGVNSVVVTGAGASGIIANSVTGATNVNVLGAGVTSSQADALTLTGLSVSVNTLAGSTIAGQTAGIRATSTNGTGITNRGTIGSTGGYAIDVTGGPAGVTNLAGGVINGRVRLSDNADVINNAGTFNAVGVSLFGAGADTVNNTGTWNANAGADFGAGADVFNNSGTFSVLNGGFPVGNVTFANLETFNNTGLVSLQNGRAGDSFTLPGVFAGGANSRLALDVNFAGATPVADRLVIGSATGSTGVSINNVGGGVLTPGVVIVDSATASPTNAFVLDPANVNLDLVQYQIVYDGPTANFLLVGTPQSVVFQQALAGEAAGNLWRKTSESWSNHMTSVRDGAWAGDETAMSEGAHVWGEFLGGVDSRDTDGQFTTFGVNQTVEMGYDQSYVGYQGGIDWFRPMGAGTLAMGVTGGYAGAYLDFNDDGGSIDFTGFNVGASVGYSQGGLFVNGLVKADFLQGDTSLGGIAQYAEFDAKAYGATLEGGYRFGGSTFFVEPVASLSYVRTELDDFDVLASSIRYDDNDSLRGKVGLRGGGVWKMSGGGRVIPYGAVYAVEEFQGEDGLTFTNGGIDVPINNLAPDTYGQAQLGLGFSPWTGALSGFTGYVQADGNFGNDMSGGGLRLGFRFKW